MMKYSEMRKAAEKSGAFTDLTPSFFEFKQKGDGFCGRLKHTAPVTSGLNQGTYNQYLFETDSGLVKCAFGNATDKEVESLLKLGNIYIIEYLGKAKISGGRSVNKFKINEIDESAIFEESPTTGLDKPKK